MKPFTGLAGGERQTLLRIFIRRLARAKRSRRRTGTVGLRLPVARLAAVILGLAAPAQACDLSLVLAVDASASVDADEYLVQTQGLASALRAPDVVSAILAGGGVHLSVFEWSGRWQQVMIVDWTDLDGEAAIKETAARIAANQRRYAEFPTSMGAALGFAQRLMDRAPAPCIRKVIDVSGDGVHNDSYGPRYAYKYYDFSDITVNGLVIRGATPDPLPFYYAEVLHGPDAFVEEADGFAAFERAMRRKLLREIRGEFYSGLPR